jgi:pilus assembly protein CpaF
MRSYEQATLTDAEAEIGEAVEFIIQTERRPGRRVVREVLRLKGYDRRAKQFLFESICEVDHATA